MLRRFPAVIVVVGFLLVVLCAGIVQATPTLDQQHLPQATGQALTVANDRTQIQTFTVGVTGVLTRIDVRVERSPNTVEDLDLSLWSTDVAGLPKDLLATVSVPSSAVPGPGFTEELTTFDLSAEAVAVSAGELLAILLNSNASNEPPFFEERYGWAFSGQYDRGTAYTRVGPDLIEQSEDFHFRTYVSSGTIQVAIDIKPGRFPNVIELDDDDECDDDDENRVAVAILSTPAFDARSVDTSTIELGDPRLTERARPIRSRVKKVDRDRDKDLLLIFSVCDLLTEGALDVDTTELVLTGQTVDGIQIEGSDAVVIEREDEDED